MPDASTPAAAPAPAPDPEREAQAARIRVDLDKTVAAIGSDDAPEPPLVAANREVIEAQRAAQRKLLDATEAANHERAHGPAIDAGEE